MPRGEEDVSISRMNCNGTSIFNASHDGFAMSTIQFGYSHVLGMSVNPIQLVIDPIHSNAFQTIGIMFNHWCSFSQVILFDFGLENGFGCDISKVQIARFVIVVQ